MKILTATTADTPEALINDLRALVRDAELMFSAAPGETSGDIPGDLLARNDSRKERLADFCRTARNGLTAGARHADHVIRANPYRSLGFALGAGVLVGVLLGRRSR